jgi:hypothetical protein
MQSRMARCASIESTAGSASGTFGQGKSRGSSPGSPRLWSHPRNDRNAASTFHRVLGPSPRSASQADQSSSAANPTSWIERPSHHEK